MDENLIIASEMIENNWQRGTFAEFSTGKVCLDGALRIAHGATLISPDLMPNENVAGYDRSLARLASVLPDCPPYCPDVNKVSHWSDDSKVWHYNDEHCDGGVTAAKLLREAAEVEL